MAQRERHLAQRVLEGVEPRQAQPDRNPGDDRRRDREHGAGARSLIRRRLLVASQLLDELGDPDLAGPRASRR